MKKLFLAVLLAVSVAAFPARAFAEDNSASVRQEGSSTSGHAVAGQVVRIEAGPGSHVTVRATNETRHVSVRSRSVRVENSFSVTPSAPSSGPTQIDVFQATWASSGDAVSGQVIGVFAAFGQSIDIVAFNVSG